MLTVRCKSSVVMDCDWYSFYFYFPEPSKTLFVKGLSEDTTEETLKESFDGSIRARIVTDRETGSSKGWVRGRKCVAFHLESSYWELPPWVFSLSSFLSISDSWGFAREEETIHGASVVAFCLHRGLFSCFVRHSVSAFRREVLSPGSFPL